MAITGKSSQQHYHYQSERTAYRQVINTIFTVLPILPVLTIGILLSACNKPDKYQFDTSRSAVETYRGFLSKMKSTKTSNTKEFATSPFTSSSLATQLSSSTTMRPTTTSLSMTPSARSCSVSLRPGAMATMMSSPSRSRPAHIKIRRN